MKLKLLILLLISASKTYSMESSECGLKEVPELRDIIVEAPCHEFIESWKINNGKLALLKSIATKKIADDKIALEGKVPVELLDFCNKLKKMISEIKLILGCKACSSNKQKFFLNLINKVQFYGKAYFTELELDYLNAIKEFKIYGLKTPIAYQTFCQSNQYSQTLLDGILLKELESATQDCKKLLTLALSLGADPNCMSDLSKSTALKICISKRSKKNMKMLIKAGAKINAKDRSGNTALTLAVGCDNKEIVKMLLDANADIDAQNEFGCTALIKAVMENREQVIQLLLKAGANINLKTMNGETALRIAQLTGRANLVKVLKEAEAKQYQIKK